MRLFIAIPVTEDIKNRITSVQDDIRKDVRGKQVRWVKPSAMHLTLNFLGEVDPGSVRDIAGCMRRAAAGAKAFSVTASGTGVFPDKRRPRVLWVGCRDESGSIERIKKTLDADLSLYGFVPEKRKFSPHITAGRVRQPEGASPELEKFLSYKEEMGIMRVDSLQLVKSELDPGGARYTVIENVGF
ncbi:MAG: RNA 2',3'-cyclic phosphodiesterase [Elusimicrobia bacterium]|nr:RNA 2',3'-cyclic phosphodiesterase [Elusimicrobiota bacterium]